MVSALRQIPLQGDREGIFVVERTRFDRPSLAEESSYRESHRGRIQSYSQFQLRLCSVIKFLNGSFDFITVPT